MNSKLILFFFSFLLAAAAAGGDGVGAGGDGIGAGGDGIGAGGDGVGALGGDGGGPDSLLPLPLAPLILPVRPPLDPVPVSPRETQPSIDWHGVIRQSSWLVGVQHAFRLATEPGTRNASGAPLSGYLKSAGNLHGWSDGDPFYVNYIGHPMQGAVAGYIWAQNDRRFSSATFGANSHYWKSRLRAAAYSWAYSTQFEIGPVSEASIGYIQSRHPQQGLVDHVVTPTIGLGWMVAEDAIDRYVLLALERQIQNRYVRILARGFLTPTRSMANMMAGKVPFYREGRSTLTDSFSLLDPVAVEQEPPDLPDNGPAPFELTTAYARSSFTGGGGCSGGGAEAAFRLAPKWQFVVDVNGCSLGGLPGDMSGDTLTYLVGPRWTPSEKRLRPYMQFLIGGTKISTEQTWPDKKKTLLEAAERNGLEVPSREEYIASESSHGMALAAGMGVDLNLGRAAALKLASLEYTRSWNQSGAGAGYNAGLQLKLGVTLRMGTW